jgi:hypothetical protein
MSAPTRGPVNTIYGVIGTIPTVILNFYSGNGIINPVQNLLQIQNTSDQNKLAYTFDGAVPAINGNGNTLPPYWDEQCDTYVINGPGPLTMVGSAPGTTFTIKYA